MAKTIYDHLIQCQKRMTLDCFKVNLDKELCLLFKQLTGIDLSSERYPFIRDGGDLQFGVTVHYKFKYGYMTVKTRGTKLTVTLFYEDQLNLPSQSNNCVIDVDYNLNFIQATFEDSLPLSKKHLNPNLFISHFYIKINHILTLDSYEKKLSCNDGLNGEVFDLHNGLDLRFHNKDFDFDDIFIRLMRLVNYSPAVFYIGFPKYPSYKDLLTNTDSVIAFVNMFIHDYFNDFNSLNANIDKHYLLADMENI